MQDLVPEDVMILDTYNDVVCIVQDLVPEDVMILDTYYDVFIWVCIV